MKQFRLFINLDKEENYLNQMASKGWLLQKRSIFGRYYFVQRSPQQIDYKVDYRIFSKKEDFNSYISIFEDSGFQHIWGTYYSGYQYFLAINKEVSRDIFSDKESKAQRYIRLQRNCIFLVITMIIYAMVNFIAVKFNLSQLFFLTPGLWEMQGAKFWRAFWFEFPFMLMRVLPVVVLAIVAIWNACLAIKAKQLYEKVILQEENQCL